MVAQSAQQCRGLDIPDRETVPEPDGGFIVSRFQRYFVHSTIPFLFPGKKGRGEAVIGSEREDSYTTKLPEKMQEAYAFRGVLVKSSSLKNNFSIFHGLKNSTATTMTIRIMPIIA
jgi:hypothetical protein